VLDDRGLIPGRGKDVSFSIRHRFQTGSGTHPASYLLGAVGKVIRGVKLTTHAHIASRLRMRGATSPLPSTSTWHGA
jgi:hypothetical protein